MPQRSSNAMDALLAPFLQCSGEVEAQRHLERLFKEHIDPIVEGILRRKVGADPGEGGAHSRRREEWFDLRGDVRIRLVARLQEAKGSTTAPPIEDFPGYVAVTVYNTVNMYLRKKRPLRYSLENKLSYLLEHQPGLALWRDARGVAVGGFAVWRDKGKFSGGRLQALLDNPQQFAQTALPRDSASHINPALLLAAIFNFVGHPVERDDLVSVVAELWGIQDTEPEPPTEEDRLSGTRREDQIHHQVTGRLDLRRYWREIAQLPPKQCAALLLQAQDPDGNSLIALLEMQGVASLREIAAAIDLPAETLAALWNDLPLEDARIAQHLGVTTQHITRMRMMARRRIAEGLAPLLSAG